MKKIYMYSEDLLGCFLGLKKTSFSVRSVVIK